MQGDRCGYEHDVGTAMGGGAVCCWRPTWNDAERCLWHADVGGKREVDLVAADPRPGERLDGATLRGVTLVDADLLAGCRLDDADFADATLAGSSFVDTGLRRADFRGASARDATFEGADLEDATFTSADLRGANFRDARLYRAAFTDVRLDDATAFGHRVVYDELATAADDPVEVTSHSEPAIATYRELQRVWRDNVLPGRSQEYFLREMDLRRRVAWATGAYVHALRFEGSRLVMRYGASPWRVIAASIALMVLCAVLYPITGGIQESTAESAITYQLEDPADAPLWALSLVFFKSLYFSAVTFATLGYGDMQPIGEWARAIAAVESLVGSLLMALLVFVLTRSAR
ncbi:ion transporter [Halostella sp. JP-L12]|uniref:pentapeptide repeat-containing protein n=1 Tax=Halostella TaxID=1843185 RepID=UPI000EF7D0FE|nr:MULTISPECIES: pentapeptide repeat-containing protein [Halostella]NHN46249.1 ion transporter [Halostella sp. JP-L12]